MARKNITNTLDENLYKEIRRLALDMDINANDLIEEGMSMVLKKHKRTILKEASKE